MVESFVFPVVGNVMGYVIALGSGGSSRHDNAGAPEEECSGKGGRIIESNGTMVNGG